MNCPWCGDYLRTNEVDTTFPYGAGSHLVELPVTLTVFTCAGCGESFCDDTAEDAKQEAIDHWLKRIEND